MKSRNIIFETEMELRLHFLLPEKTCHKILRYWIEVEKLLNNVMEFLKPLQNFKSECFMQ